MPLARGYMGVKTGSETGCGLANRFFIEISKFVTCLQRNVTRRWNTTLMNDIIDESSCFR